MNHAQILLVEDNAMNTRLFRKILEFRGHHVVCATTVDEGKAALRRTKPDLVLLDVQIPGGGGETLLAHIRATAALRDLPVVAVTALAMQGDRQRLLAAGFDSYISKPIDTRQFGVQVESMLKPKTVPPVLATAGRNVLLVEDDDHFRALIAPLLESKGFEVVEAANGEAADEAVKKKTPDLVIVDYHLPDTTGTSWLARWRSQGMRTKVMLVSSFWRDLRSLRELIQELEIAQVLKKPIIPAVLVELVETLLGVAPPSVRDTIELSDQISAMRASYSRELPGHVAALADVLERTLGEPEREDVLAQARGDVHKLLGSAGSYGFHELGDVLARMESVLRRDGGPLSADSRRELGALVDEMTRCPTSITASQPTVVHGPGRVLVVDRDPEILRLLGEVGKKQLWEVSAATTVEEAIALAGATPPDAAVIDIGLPDEGAFALARALRAPPDREALPIAFTSQEDRFAQRVAIAHLGASVYLPKPLSPDVVVSTIDQLLSIKKAEQPRILVVDDDERFCEYLRTLLEGAGMAVSTLTDSTRVLEVLDEQHPELVLLDMAMPGVSGFDVCRILRSTPSYRDLPIVFVSSRQETESRVAGFQAGGDDFLAKPVVTEELLVRAGNLVQRSRLLRERAEKDALTSILLRRAFLERAGARLTEARRRARPLAIGLLDLDHFKKINDVRGHLIGDRVLASMGKLLARRFRPTDLRARWGGEEFIVAFPEEDAETIEGVLSRFLDEWSSINFEDEAGHSFRVTFSAGVASFPADGDSLEALVRVADRRLYSAKKHGRGRVVGPTTPMPTVIPTGTDVVG